MPNKPTPQIQKCAEACAEYAKDCWCPEGDEIIQVDEDGGQDIDEDKVEKRVKARFAALIMEHTGAEMMPEMYQRVSKMESVEFEYHGDYFCPICGSLREIWGQDITVPEPHDKDCPYAPDNAIGQALFRLGELGYGKEE